MTERIKLVVTETKEPQAVGDKGAKKLVFKAKNTEDKELAYLTFRPNLFPSITVGAELDAEVETTTREYEGNTYTDRKVNQLFVDGQPLAGRTREGGWRGKSPEELELSRRSFALAYAKDLAVADRIGVDAILERAAEFEQFLISGMPDAKGGEDSPKGTTKKSKEQSIGTPKQGVVTRGDMLTVVNKHLEEKGLKSEPEKKEWLGEITPDYRGLMLLSEEELEAAYKKALAEIAG